MLMNAAAETLDKMSSSAMNRAGNRWCSTPSQVIDSILVKAGGTLAGAGNPLNHIKPRTPLLSKIHQLMLLTDNSA